MKAQHKQHRIQHDPDEAVAAYLADLKYGASLDELMTYYPEMFGTEFTKTLSKHC